ncbi:NACHT and WD repeat domain-containing protein [Kutzneria sp. CA-103260]|uniref:NACHT and WD repeat domain-containing protein n=1 Tax=Kutzneria sp. CA-103260 TaxID=2802641 RepID=UPI001BA70040|nr:NACHT and WD repeat domain-containing protein [Kutzneria sp. CA-103260]QUQ66010.1 Tol-Pal system protein TolB [Kutzneria sp. CA-103260]
MPRSERPLDPGDTPLLRFAADLRRLRESAGSPVYRELSVKAHYSVAVLSEAAGGRKLPTLAVTLAYVDACGGDAQEWERRWREVADTQEGPAIDDSGLPPYLGLSAFQIEDAGRFHGRGALLAHLSNHILNRRLVVVFGASGAGKSSLLRAGLAAASLRDGVDGLGPQHTVVFTPGAHPTEECALWLADLVAASAAELRSELRADPTALHLRLRQALADDAREALVIVDQFEEVFTLCADEDERLAFITALMHLATVPTSVVRLVLGVRADFFGHCLQYPQLRQVLGEGPVLVGAMTADELRLAITKPAIDLGYTVETALVTRLVSEATNQPGVLPLMSHALLETWRRRQGITLTAAGYDAAGGISHALGRTAESVYSGLTPDRQSVARQVFLRLTALGDGTEDTRRRVSRAELDHVDNLSEVLSALVDARLITVDQDGVDIAHEALISHWPRLREWLTEDRDGLRTQRQLTEAAEIWDSLNRDDGALYRGARLEMTREWVRSSTPSLSHRERAFFNRSVELCLLEALTAKRRTRRLKQFVALLVVLSVALAGTTVYSLVTQQTIRHQRDQVTIQAVLDRLPDLRVSNPVLADELTLAVYRSAPSAQTRGLLLALPVNTQRNSWRVPNGSSIATQALDSTSSMLADLDYDKNTLAVDVLTVSGDVSSTVSIPAGETKIDTVALAPDGQRLAVVRGGDGQAEAAELWDISDHTKPVLSRTYPVDVPVGVAFSPDSRLLVISSDNSGTTVGGRTSVWDLSDPAASAPRGVLPDTNGPITFSADGGWLLSAPHTTVSPADATASGTSEYRTDPGKLWDMRQVLSGKPPRPVAAPGISINSALSPHGTMIATTQQEPNAGSFSLWQLKDGGLTKTTSVTTGLQPRRPAFSPDGRYVALLENEDTVSVWDVSAPTALALYAILPAANGTGRGLAFTRNGHLTVVEPNAVQTRGLDANAAAAKVCAEVRRSDVVRDKWPAWNTFFPSMDVPEPCPR